MACGDRVNIVQSAPGQGVVEATDARTSLLYRSDAYRTKVIAANVTQIVVVLAPVPSWYEELLNRCLVAAEATGIRALIVLNKADLAEETRVARVALTLYETLGYRVLSLSAKREVQPLLALLHGERSVLVGQSGMGKSTIVNALLPDARERVAEISTALDSGRHTTTSARLHRLNPESSLIDSPGLQAFGLHHLAADEIAHAFPEFRPLLGECRFSNCRHLQEPGCAVADAERSGQIAKRRLDVYRRIITDRLVQADAGRGR